MWNRCCEMLMELCERREAKGKKRRAKGGAEATLIVTIADGITLIQFSVVEFLPTRNETQFDNGTNCFKQ